jgi:hypothetical protein
MVLSLATRTVPLAVVDHRVVARELLRANRTYVLPIEVRFLYMSSHALYVHDTTAIPPVTHELRFSRSGNTME